LQRKSLDVGRITSNEDKTIANALEYDGENLDFNAREYEGESPDFTKVKGKKIKKTEKLKKKKKKKRDKQEKEVPIFPVSDCITRVTYLLFLP